MDYAILLLGVIFSEMRDAQGDAIYVLVSIKTFDYFFKGTVICRRVRETCF